MDYKVTVSDINITKEDLVNLLCTATYNNPDVNIIVPDEWKHLKREGECLEENWANVLIGGGRLTAIVEDFGDECDYSGDTDVLMVTPNEDERIDADFVGYAFGMERIKKAFEEIVSRNPWSCDEGTLDCVYHAFQAMFVDECGDVCDAWNVLQYVLFGDIIFC